MNTRVGVAVECEALDDAATLDRTATRHSSRHGTRGDAGMPVPYNPFHSCPAMLTTSVVSNQLQSADLPRVTGIKSLDFQSRSDHYTLYRITVSYQGWDWTLSRRFREVVRVHDTLTKWIPKHAPGCPLPPLPPTSFFGRFDSRFIEKRAAGVLALLTAVARTPEAWQCPVVPEFFEVGVLSFKRLYSFGVKGKEGWATKRSGGRKIVSNPLTVVDRWTRRWCVLKGTVGRVDVCVSLSIW